MLQLLSRPEHISTRSNNLFFIAGIIVGVVAGCTCAACVILVVCLFVYRLKLVHKRKSRGYAAVAQKHIVVETPIVETKVMYTHW